MIQGHNRQPIGIPDAPGGNDYRTTLLIQSKAANGDTTFTDTSHGGNYGTGHTVTAHDGARHVGRRSRRGGGMDLRLAKYLTVPNHADFDLNALPEWTIDFWWFPLSRQPSNAAHHFVAGNIIGGTRGNRGWGFMQENANGRPPGSLYFYADGRTFLNFGAGESWANSMWHHVAVVRYNDRLWPFKDGALKVAHKQDVSRGIGPSSETSLKIGRNDQIGWGAGANGYVDEFRISNWPRWLSDFTPSTTPYER